MGIYPIRRKLFTVLPITDRVNLLCAFRVAGAYNESIAHEICADIFVEHRQGNLAYTNERKLRSVEKLMQSYEFVDLHTYINYTITTAIHEVLLFRNLLIEEVKYAPKYQYEWTYTEPAVIDRFFERHNNFKNFLLVIRKHLTINVSDLWPEDENNGVMSNAQQFIKHSTRQNNTKLPKSIHFELRRYDAAMTFDLWFSSGTQKSNHTGSNWENDALQVARRIFLDASNPTRSFFFSAPNKILNDNFHSVFYSCVTPLENCPFLTQFPAERFSDLNADNIRSVYFSTENVCTASWLLDHTIDSFVEVYRRLDENYQTSGFVVQTKQEIEEHLIGMKHHKCTMNSTSSLVCHNAMLNIYGPKLIMGRSDMSAMTEKLLNEKLIGSNHHYDGDQSKNRKYRLKVHVQTTKISVYVEITVPSSSSSSSSSSSNEQIYDRRKLLIIHIVHMPKMRQYLPPKSLILYGNSTSHLLVEPNLLIIESIRFKYIPRVTATDNVQQHRKNIVNQRSRSPMNCNGGGGSGGGSGATNTYDVDDDDQKIEQQRSNHATPVRRAQTHIGNLKRRQTMKKLRSERCIATTNNTSEWLKFACIYYDYHAINRTSFVQFLKNFWMELRKKNDGKPFYNYFHIQQIHTAVMINSMSEHTACPYHVKSILLHSRNLFEPSSCMEHQCFTQYGNTWNDETTDSLADTSANCLRVEPAAINAKGKNYGLLPQIY